MTVKQTAKIGKGKAGPGRPRGVPNKTTTTLKEAILLAAEQVGEDGDGTGGLSGYCKRLALNEPVAFASLMGKVIPLQVSGDPDNPIVHRIERAIVYAKN